MPIVVAVEGRFDGEIHRYFPDWADWPARESTPVEWDRNSYSAGGYAEEFGYGIQAGLPPPLPSLRAQPESYPSLHWFSMGLHPGYPERATPLDRDRMLATTETLTLVVANPAHDPLHSSRVDTGTRQQALPELNVIRVGYHRRAGHVAGVSGGVLGWWRALRLRQRRL